MGFFNKTALGRHNLNKARKMTAVLGFGSRKAYRRSKRSIKGL